MTDVIAGKTGKDSLSVLDDNTQVYGLAGNDTLKSNGKNNVLLIGGSGDDRLIMTGGNGTLSGGKGKDVFELNYSADKKISAVIEDIDPTNDKIVVTFDGSSAPQLSSVKSGNDVIWTDSNGYFNLTLKSASDASDYFDGTASSEIWDVLRITNDEREKEGLPWLTLSQGLADGAAIRSTEIIEKFSHTRPDDTSCFTAVTKSYWSMGENIAAGQTSPENVVTGWMNSPGHRANILNSDFKKLGVGYTYDASSDYKYHWVQMFGGGLTSPDTLSAEKILSTTMTVQKGSLSEDDAAINTVIDADNTTIKRGGTYTIAKNFTGTIRINTTDAVTIDGTSAGSLKDVSIITNVANADLTIKNLTVTDETGSAITFGTGTDNKLTLAGKSVLKTSDTWAAVVNVGGGLTIDGTGSLDVTAGKQGSGIGFNSYGESTANIAINGGTITTTTDMGAGIGSGCNGSIGNISINGGTVTTTSDYGAGIGSGYDGSTGNIAINGGNITTTTSFYGAGIGSGYDGSVGNITITNGTITAVSKLGEGFIGSGRNGSVGNITINGGTVNAIASMSTDSTKPLKMTGTSIADSINNSLQGATIQALGGNDFVHNYGDSVSIDGGDGDDYIYSTGVNSTIIAGNGNDSVDNYGDSVSINASIGNNSVDNYGDSVSVNGGDGDDTVYSNGNNSTIIAGKGNDTVDNRGDSVTINAGTGNDSVDNRGDSVSVDGGDNNDFIINGGYFESEHGGKNFSVTGGKGNDTITSHGSNSVLDGGDNDDLIYNGCRYSASSNYFYDSNDSNYNGDNSTIIAGEGNDSIRNLGHKVIINAGEGNDIVKNFGDSVSIDASSGDDTVYNDSDNSTIVGGEGNDSITNYDGDKVTISAGDGNDSVNNYGDSVSIDGGAGNDLIINNFHWKHSGKNFSVRGGKGNDTIATHGSNSVLDGGDNDDLIYNGYRYHESGNYFYASNDSNYNGDNSKIIGGAGNDTIKNRGNKVIFQYSSGNGNDIIEGFNATSTLSISGSDYSSTKSNDDVIVTVGTGKITLQGAASLSSVNVIGKQTDPTKLTVTDKTSSPVTIGAAVETVDASKRTKAIQITGNDLANSIVGGSKNDSLYGGKGNDSILGNAGNDKLYGEVGNDLLSGGAGNDTLTGGDGDDIFIYSAGKDVIADYATGDKISLGAAISKSSVKGADVIFTIGSGSLTVKNGKGKTLNLIDSAGKESSTIFGNDVFTYSNSSSAKVTLGSSYKTADASKRTKAIQITGNDLANSIVGGSKNDSLYGGKGADTLRGGSGNDKLFGEVGNDLLSGGAGNDTLTGGDGDDIFIYSAGKDVIADYATGDKISLGAAISKSSVKGSDVIFTIGSGSLTVKNGKGKTLNLIDSAGKESSTIFGNDVFTYSDSSSAKVTLGSSYKTADASKRTKAIQITGNDLANSIVGGTKNDSLYGGKGADTLQGNSGNDKLFGEVGNDLLSGGAGNDTLTGGDGDDIFIYSAGKDVILDYATGDKISLGAAISKSSVKGSDVVFTIGSGSLTVKNGKGKTLNLIDSAGKESSTIFGGDVFTYSDSSSAKVTLGSSYKTADASKRTKAIQITGNDLANSIVGGSKNDSLYGGKGADTLRGGNGNDKLFGEVGNDLLYGGAGSDSLWGGAGNDSLWGDAGADTFIYSSGDGKDVIFGFDDTDMLEITGAFSASYNKSKNQIAFKVGSTASAITLRDFTATTFNINGDDYKISGTKLVKS